MPQALGHICDALWGPTPALPSERRWACQGFTFDASTNTSCFFGQNQQYKLDLNGMACKRPGAAIWALTAGARLPVLLTLSFLADRPIHIVISILKYMSLSPQPAAYLQYVF